MGCEFDFSSFEEDLLVLKPSTTNCHSNMFKRILNGEFLAVINDFCECLFTTPLDKTTFSNIDEYFSSCLEVILLSDNLNYEDADILCVGVACFCAFLQCNWTGPPISSDGDDAIINGMKNHCPLFQNKCLDDVTDHVQKCLAYNGEKICTPICRVELLSLSKCIFQCPNLHFPSTSWWLIRSLRIHQLILDEPAVRIHSQLMNLIKSVESNLYQTKNIFLITLFSVEVIQIHLHLYSEITKARKYVTRVTDLLGLETFLAGALGKRTQFQSRDIAQLMLKVVLDDGAHDNINTYRNYLQYSATNLPSNCVLDDTVRLPDIKFVNEADGQYVQLNILQQLAVLSIFSLNLKSKPKDEIKCEELLPYLKCLIAHPKIWSIQTAALAFRCRLESDNSRSIQRSLTQLQALVDSIDYLDPPAIDRLFFFYCSYVPSKWKLQEELGCILLQLGAVQSALDLFLQVEAWEEIVACYTVLKLKHKAAEVLRCQIGKGGDTVKMWCLLGDVTDDENCYEKAWLLSECRSGRAQRHWALFHFNKKQYEKSISHFQKSLQINSLQVSLWFNLGYAALVQKNWLLSASAYRRYCHLEPQCFEAWNNLGKAYIKLGEKHRAMKALQEAVKYSYDNWKIWDNLLTVSADCADFFQVICCYHRLLDLKGKHTDVEVLNILVETVCFSDINISNLKKETLKLFGRITSQVTNNADIWKLYAKLTSCMEEEVEKESKVVQYLQRAHRILTQVPTWTQSVANCKEVVSVSLKLADAYETYCNQLTNEHGKMQLNSAKLTLRGIILKIQKEHMSFDDKSNADEIGIGILRERLIVIEDKISNMS